MKTRFLAPLLGFVLAALAGGCDNPKSPSGFRLPDGDIPKGKQAFIALKCNSCHSVEGVEMPPPSLFNMPLGGETPRVKTYGQLVTAIINPSHVVSEKYRKLMGDLKISPMPEMNREMTVEQMIDLVAFLQSRYKLIVPPEQNPFYP